ncbi:MAG: hypothetical protein OXF08_06660 [Bacteroidetes bacterium]|nr:hypothetical protein [Bacteroidota bacterium]
MTQLPHEIQRFAKLFLQLQTLRYDADYDPHARFRRSQVLRDILRTKEAIIGFKVSKIYERKAFVAFVTGNIRQ